MLIKTTQIENSNNSLEQTVRQEISLRDHLTQQIQIEIGMVVSLFRSAGGGGNGEKFHFWVTEALGMFPTLVGRLVPRSPFALLREKISLILVRNLRLRF